MNPSKHKKTRTLAHAVALVSLLATFMGCQSRVLEGDGEAMEGGSMDETSTLAFHRRDGSPAVGARVQLFGSADTGVEPRVQVITNTQGGVDLPAPEKGFYNLVVRGRDGDALFQDSLYSNGSILSVAPDTLRHTGTLTGRIRVQPQHSPRIAWIHVLGAGIWSNVDDSGRFVLEGVPAGKYTVAAYTLVDGYTPTFAKVQTISDSTVDAGDIQLVFTGLPVVRNLEARFDTLAGLVHLRWDSIPLRESWRYNVYRNDTLIGETTGSLWADDISRQYAASIPAEGRHTYRVVVANADTLGPKWESIAMRVVSAYLYQEIKIDWERMGDLPWTPGLFKVDSVGGDLVVWRSAEFGEIRKEWDVRNVHPGWIEMWISRDGGTSWAKQADSLPLGALPERHDGKWWSIRRATGPLILDERTIWTRNVGLKYDTVQVVSSEDGLRWHEVEKLAVPKEMVFGTFRFQVWQNDLYLIGSGPFVGMTTDSQWWVSEYFTDLSRWRFRKDATFEAQELTLTNGSGYHLSPAWIKWSASAELKEVCSGGRSLTIFYNPALFGYEFRTGAFASPRTKDYAAELKRDQDGWTLQSDLKALSIDGRGWVVFGRRNSISLDTTLSILHTVSWPGAYDGAWSETRPYGMHEEILFRGRILSWTEAGIFRGTIRPPVEDGARGSWVKKTEIPVKF
ncbi:MAG TPA: hypothetical protein PKO15_17020 [Fibrobacteria bacterium]|nr:hypothetical protein [Fibrobacteria bacterium]